MVAAMYEGSIDEMKDNLCTWATKYGTQLSAMKESAQLVGSSHK
jgi:hypothetical protein